MASMPASDNCCAAATTLASSRGSTTLPSAAMRSATSRRWRRGTSGLGLSHVRSNMSGMRMRPISSTSRKPRVVMRPVRAPERWRRVLEPTVVPCSTSSTRAGLRSSSSSRAATPATTARLGSSGVVDTLLSLRTPSPAMTTMSVNVPPISTATRTPSCTFPDARSLQEAMQLQAIVVVKEPIISYHFVHTTCAVRRHVGLDLPATTTFGRRPAWTPGIMKPTLTR